MAELIRIYRDGVLDHEHSVDDIDRVEIYTLSLAPPPPTGQTWNWNTDGNLEGWTFLYQLSNLRASGGFLSANIAGNDPQIYSPDVLGKSAATHPKITVRMRNTSPGILGRIFFITDADQVWDGAKTKSFPVLANSGFTDYVIDMSTVATWTGTIRRFRVDPVENVTGSFDFDWLRIGT